MIFVLAALLWLPASVHCQLEAVPGLEFFACQSETSSSGNPNSHCDDSGCCSVERSPYRAEISHLMPVTPDLLPPAFAVIAPVPDSWPAEVRSGVLTAAPPQLLKTWHFVSRTALPIRAPSLVS